MLSAILIIFGFPASIQTDGTTITAGTNYAHIPISSQEMDPKPKPAQKMEGNPGKEAAHLRQALS